MKRLRNLSAQWAALLGIAAVVMLLAGCQPFSDEQGVGPVYGELPTGVGSGGTNSGSWTPASTDSFHIGDLVMISYSASVAGSQIIPPYDERIREDGTITPPFIHSVVAVGKPPGELQKELQKEYDKYYRNLTVTVKAGERYYYVDGEVNRKGPVQYLGDTDLRKAISAAGGFTDFAKQSRVSITHPNGKKDTVNYKEVIADPSYKVPIYPGDNIYVPRRWF